MNKFRLPIGDWSDDGHGRVDRVAMESNKTVEELREIYFATVEKVGYALDGQLATDAPCAEYGDYTVTKEQIKRLGLDENAYENLDDVDLIANLFVDFIVTHNTGVEINILAEEPMFPFFGFDEKKRHIGYMGYGLFS